MKLPRCLEELGRFLAFFFGKLTYLTNKFYDLPICNKIHRFSISVFVL
jgi:hypothetical protein